MTKPSAAPRTRHIALPGLAGEPWDLGNPNGPQSCVTDTPLRRPNSPASLRAALGQSTVAISEEQARTARVGTPLPRHTPGCSAAACLAQACHLYPVCVNICSCTTSLDVSLTYIPACTPHRAALVLCKRHVFHTSQHFPTVPTHYLAHCKKGHFQHILKPQTKAQLFGWEFRHHLSSDTLTEGVREMEQHSSDHQMYNCVWTAAGQYVRHCRSSLNRPISQKNRALCQLNY